MTHIRRARVRREQPVVKGDSKPDKKAPPPPTPVEDYSSDVDALIKKEPDNAGE